MSRPRPPARTRALLARVLPSRDRDAILGDLEEEFRERAAREGPGPARWWFRREVLRSLLPALRRRWEGRTAARDWKRMLETRGEGMMKRLGYDVRHALRSLVRRPGFTLVVVLTLAMGVGTTTAVYSVVDGVLLRPLPYPDADRIHHLWERTEEGHLSWVSAPNFLDWREQLGSFEAVAALTPAGFNVAGGDGHPERARGAEVSPGFFRVLGVRMALGRSFLDEEGGTPAAPVAVVSHGLWERQLGGSPSAVGQSVVLDGTSYRVVGVLPRGAEYPVGRDVWVPVDLVDAEWKRGRGTRWLMVLGRLRPEVAPTVALDELAAVGRALSEAYPEANGTMTIASESLLDRVVGDARSPLLVLLAAVGLVLLVVCVNVAGMLLARGIRREREMAIRRSLGGSRGRLLGQLLTESALVSLAGGTLGVFLAAVEVDVLRALAPPGTPRLDGVGLGWEVLLFTLLLSLVAGVGAGILPAVRETGADPASGLLGGRGGGPKGPAGLRRVLAVAQVALAVVLAVGAGHLLESMRNLRSVDPGFRPEGVLSVALPLTEGRYQDDAAVAAFYGELLERVRSLPGVDGAGLTSLLPLGGSDFNFSFELRDQGDADGLVAGYQSVSPGYFETMGVPLLAGRAFRDGEGPDDEPVVIVDEAFARAFFPEGDAVGQEVLAVGDSWRRVVGVVGSLRRRGLREAPEPLFYVPLGQDPRDAMTLVVRVASGTEPTALVPPVRRVVGELDPTQPLVRPLALAGYVDRTLARPRFLATVVGFFGVTTLLLAVLGIYGVVSQGVAARLREIGIRMALGARRTAVQAMVVRQSLAMAVGGLVLGGLAAVPALGAARSVLFGVSQFEWSVLAGVLVVLMTAAVVAAWPPARRATRVDPVTVLRAE